MVTGAQIVAQAQAAAASNSPYVYGGNPYAGYSWAQFRSDCSGLVDRIYANLGAGFAGRPTTVDLVKMGNPVGSLAQALPGDLLFYGGATSPDHVAVYVGGGQQIADPQTGQNVKQEAVYATPSAIRRVNSGPGVSAGGGQTVVGAIKAATSDVRTQLALALGAQLEGGTLGAGPYPTGDNGQSPGPFQIRLYDNSGAPVHGNQITRAQALDPTSAVNFMLGSYQSAVNSIPNSLWQSNPQKAAEQAAFKAERPAQDYYASRGTAGVNASYQTAIAALNGTPQTATNAGIQTVGLNPNPLDGFGVPGVVGGAAADAAKAAAKPFTDFAAAAGHVIAHMIESGLLILLGIIAVFVGLVMLAHAGSGGGGGAAPAGGSGGKAPEEGEAEDAAVAA